MGDTATRTSSNLKGISSDGLPRLPVGHPAEAEQHATVQVLSDMEVVYPPTRLSLVRQLKQALTQVLLTGRIRPLAPASAAPA